MQLTKLNAATAAQTSACHQRSLKASSNSARVNSQNTTTLPVDSAISGACADRNRRRRTDRVGHGMRRRPQRKADGQPSGEHVPKPRNSDAASTSSRATVAPRNARSRVESSIISPSAQDMRSAEFNADRRPVQFWPIQPVATVTQRRRLAEQIDLAFPAARPAAARRLVTAAFSRSMQWMISSISNVANDPVDRRPRRFDRITLAAAFAGDAPADLKARPARRIQRPDASDKSAACFFLDREHAEAMQRPMPRDDGGVAPAASRLGDGLAVRR